MKQLTRTSKLNFIYNVGYAKLSIQNERTPSYNIVMALASCRSVTNCWVKKTKKKKTKN